MTGRRVPAETIATSIAASCVTVADVEKAAGLHQSELQSYLEGSDIEARHLVAASGLLGFSPVRVYREMTS